MNKEIANGNANEIASLVANAKNGDNPSFDKLYELTKNDVWFTCLSFLKDEENARDTMQETYITAFLKLDSLGDNEKFCQWIKRIAANKCLDFLRLKTKDYEEREVYLNLNLPETDELMLPEEYIKQAEKREIILQIMGNALSAYQHQTVIMYYFDNMSIAEIAEAFGCSENTVKTRLKLARKNLKKAIDEYEAKSGNKMHSVVAVPLFPTIFIEQAKSIKVPKIKISLPDKASGNELKLLSNEAKTSKVIGKGFAGTLKTKVIALACTAAVIGGGVVAGLLLINNNNADVLPVKNEVEASDEQTKEAVNLNGLSTNKTESTVDGDKNKTNDVTKKNTNTEKTTEKASESKTTEKATEKATEKTTKTGDESNSGNKVEKATEKATQKPADTQKATEKATERATERATQKPQATEPQKTWHEAEYKYVNHPAETKQEWVVDKEAYTYEEPIYETREVMVCQCGQIFFDTNGEYESHILDVFDNYGVFHSYSVEDREVQVGTRIVSPEVGQWEIK